MRPILLLLLLWLTLAAEAGEVVRQLDVDGKKYYDVRWGTLNQGKVVIFHNHGVAVVPADKLPPEYQELLGYKPVPAPSAWAPIPEPELKPVPPPAPVATTPEPPKPNPNQLLEAMRAQKEIPQLNSEWAAYNRDRLNRVLLDGKLVDKSTLKELTGFVIRTRTQISTDQRTVTGAVVELAERRKDSATVAQSMELRPSLWEPSGVRVLLQNYLPLTDSGSLIRIYGVEDETIEDHLVYRVGKEPTFEQWQTLSRR